MNQKIFIGVLAHKKALMPSNPIYVPIEVGADFRNEHFYNCLDNTGDNISNKNASYCELTGAYWTYKNNEYEYFGIAHYRRFLMKSFFCKKSLDNIIGEKEIEKTLEKYDFILPAKVVMVIHTNYLHYILAHKKEGLKVTEDIIKTDYPKYYKSYKKVMRRVYGHYFNMFVAKKETANAYLDWLFELLGKVEKRIDLDEYIGQDKRVFGYIAELMLDVYINANKLKYKEFRFACMDKHYIWNMFKGYIKSKFKKNK